MHSWVVFTGLVLLWTEAVVSQVRVNGVAGQSVTLPCTYSTAHETTSMCWGRGACSRTQCPNQLIWTDGYRVTFQKSGRYNLHGMISRGNVSLTIENAARSDSGTYCCRVEHTGWFNDLKVNILLDVKPAPPKATSAPTSPRVFTSAPTTAAPTVKLMTAPPKVTSVPASPRVSTSAPTTPSSTLNLKTETTSSSPMQTTDTQPITTQETNTTSSPSHPCPTDGNSTVMQPSEGGGQDGGNHENLKENPWASTNKALYIGLSATALILLSVLAAVITKRYFCGRRNVFQISQGHPCLGPVERLLHSLSKDVRPRGTRLRYSHRKQKLQNSRLIMLANLPPSGLENTVAEGMRSKENIYTIEENVYEIEDPSEYYTYISCG